MHKTVRQWWTLDLRDPLIHHPTASFSSLSNLLEDNVPPITEFNENFWAFVDICTIDSSLYIHMDICVILDQIKDVRRPLRDVDPMYSRKRDDLFRTHRFEHSRDLISITALPTVFEPFDLVNRVN